MADQDALSDVEDEPPWREADHEAAATEQSTEKKKQRHSAVMRRLQQFTWANFTCTQSTGGIAILLSETPKQFYGLQTIGIVIFIFNLVLFLLFTAAITTRFVRTPGGGGGALRQSLTQSPEAYFAGSFWLSMATIIICMQRFAVPRAGPWVIDAIRVLFWISTLR